VVGRLGGHLGGLVLDRTQTKIGPITIEIVGPYAPGGFTDLLDGAPARATDL
jgi:hypothetical protein